MAFTLATWNINSVRLREPIVLKLLQEVLTESGAKELAGNIPWIGASGLPEKLTPEHLQLYSLVFQLVNMVEINAAVQQRRRDEQRAGPGVVEIDLCCTGTAEFSAYSGFFQHTAVVLLLHGVGSDAEEGFIPAIRMLKPKTVVERGIAYILVRILRIFPKLGDTIVV